MKLLKNVQIKIDLKEVESELLYSYGYNEELQILDLEFNSGYYVYRYLSVPKEIVEKLLSSSKNGTFFNKEIRNRYAFYKLKMKEIYENDRHYDYLKDGMFNSEVN